GRRHRPDAPRLPRGAPEKGGGCHEVGYGNMRVAERAFGGGEPTMPKATDTDYGRIGTTHSLASSRLTSRSRLSRSSRRFETLRLRAISMDSTRLRRFSSAKAAKVAPTATYMPPQTTMFIFVPGSGQSSAMIPAS